MSKVLILFPRLDVTFKKGPVPVEIGPIPSIRIHWLNFLEKLSTYHAHILNDEVHIKEFPLWQITTDLVTKEKEDNFYDVIYMPHKNKKNFKVDFPIRYYMQMTFPHLFSIDSEGWGSDTSFYPINPTSYNPKEIPHIDKTIFKNLKKRIEHNVSKFEQPNSKLVPVLPHKFMFMPCQLPHDENVREQSNVSMEEALIATCEYTKRIGFPLIVKGHPANPGSMIPLKEIAYKYSHVTWFDPHVVSIHHLLKNCDSVFTVNSGVGLEALLHEKQVYCFGQSEYISMAYFIIPEVLENSDIRYFKKDWENRKKVLIPDFFNQYMNYHYDSTDIGSFHKLR